jgi:type IV secretion system protein VirB1
MMKSAVLKKTMLAAVSVFLTSEIPAADLSELLAKCAPNVHPTTMAALVRHESGGNPYVILDNGNWNLPKSKRILRSFRLRSQSEAITVAKKLIAAGHVIDMGLGQINNRNLKSLGLMVEQIFDSCTNLQASQAILIGNYSTAVKQYGHGDQALYAALSAYNTGNFIDGLTNGYVQKVLQAGLFNAMGILTNTNPPQSRPTSRKSQMQKAKLVTIEVETWLPSPPEG